SPQCEYEHPLSPRAHSTLTCTLTSTITKTPDPPVLRDKPETEPRPGSTGGDPLQKSQKRYSPRHKPALWERESPQEIVQNKPGSAIREGGPAEHLIHA